MLLPATVKAQYVPYELDFNFIARTSRAEMTKKRTYFLRLTDTLTGEAGMGECALFEGLSAEDSPDYEETLRSLCDTINAGELVKEEKLSSSLRFGLETAMLDLANGGKGIIYDTPWQHGKGAIDINGLVWMGSEAEMRERIGEKIAAGFRCIKLKIGGIDFDAEVRLIEGIRREFGPEKLELRLDANGAFTPRDVLDRLQQLSRYHIHSIEQPIKAGQWFAMATVCARSPIPVALDEELIGVSDAKRREAMLSVIRPRYIILKPSLCGGLQASLEWIAAARRHKAGWWITSALESNVGLNAVAALASTQHLRIPQGLGTGGLYTNNIPSPLYLEGAALRYDAAGKWDYSRLKFPSCDGL